jgi:hypothetical protein
MPGRLADRGYAARRSSYIGGSFRALRASVRYFAVIASIIRLRSTEEAFGFVSHRRCKVIWISRLRITFQPNASFISRSICSWSASDATRTLVDGTGDFGGGSGESARTTCADLSGEHHPDEHIVQGSHPPPVKPSRVAPTIVSG